MLNPSLPELWTPEAFFEWPRARKPQITVIHRIIHKTQQP